MSDRIEITYMEPGKLNPSEYNPRTITDEAFEKLKRGIERFGGNLVDPIIVRAKGLAVIGGHQRLRAAIDLGLQEIPVVVLKGLSDSKAKALNILLNNPAVQGEWDFEKLSSLVSDLDDGGFDVTLTGFDAEDIEGILAWGSEKEIQEEEVDLTPPEKPKSKRGEVYEFGVHRLMCGDATDVADVDNLMDGEGAVLLFTSPPYVDAREYRGGKNLDIDHLATFIGVFASMADILAVNLGIIRRDNEVVQHWDKYISAAETAGLKFLSWNVWDRGQPWSVAQNTAMFPVEHEWVFVFGEHRMDLNLTVANKTPGSRTGITNRQKDGSLKKVGTKKVRVARELGTIFRSPPHLGKDIGHPAMFPTAFPCAYIEAITDVGDMVCDPFVGSGTTIIAAEQTNRVCYAMEIDEGYCDVIRRRYATFVKNEKYLP